MAPNDHAVQVQCSTATRKGCSSMTYRILPGGVWTSAQQISRPSPSAAGFAFCGQGTSARSPGVCPPSISFTCVSMQDNDRKLQACVALAEAILANIRSVTLEQAGQATSRRGKSFPSQVQKSQSSPFDPSPDVLEALGGGRGNVKDTVVVEARRDSNSATQQSDAFARGRDEALGLLEGVVLRDVRNVAGLVNLGLFNEHAGN
jgi:hypothetical protein